MLHWCVRKAAVKRHCVLHGRRELRLRELGDLLQLVRWLRLWDAHRRSGELGGHGGGGRRLPSESGGSGSIETGCMDSCRPMYHGVCCGSCGSCGGYGGMLG